MQDNFNERQESDFEYSEEEYNTKKEKKLNTKLNIFLSATIGILSFLVIILIICILYFWNNKATLSEKYNSASSATS